MPWPEVAGPIQPARTCPYSGEQILICKRVDLCDCFDFPEYDRREHYALPWAAS